MQNTPSEFNCDTRKKAVLPMTIRKGKDPNPFLYGTEGHVPYTLYGTEGHLPYTLYGTEGHVLYTMVQRGTYGTHFVLQMGSYSTHQGGRVLTLWYRGAVLFAELSL